MTRTDYTAAEVALQLGVSKATVNTLCLTGCRKVCP